MQKADIVAGKRYLGEWIIFKTTVNEAWFIKEITIKW